ncbi:MAG: hypothetical protein ACREDM_11270, partial [Methylocella sp.]
AQRGSNVATAWGDTSSTQAPPPQIAKIAARVEAFQHLNNHQRPHGALAGKTPAEYLPICRAAETPQSHMS